MQTTDTSEKGLEIIIENHLLNINGFQQSHSKDYDRDLCINTKILFEFIQKTQPTSYDKLIQRGKDKFLKRLKTQIKQKGIITLLRKGIKDLDLHTHLYYNKPSSDLNQKAITNYNANNFSVTRQLYYSLANSNSLDMAVFISGLPIITLELKNHWTGQTVKNAIVQYQKDRDSKEPLFAFGRCMVHYAVDSNLVYMTTHLNGTKTFFLPFNKGDNDGAGNPVNPNGLKTSYLWEDSLTKENLSNIIENYAQIVEEKDEDTGKIKKKLIYPRYHQLRAVDNVLNHAKTNGVGQRYLIQHSVGSGKSYSITWLAHQLVSLHNSDNTNTVFDSIIVVTDRRVLDKQIRDNIKQFAQVSSVVEAIDKGSRQLKKALEDGKKIIVTTVQKFPFIMDEIGTLRAKRFAIIIDEAHSSQSGETASKMNWVLSDKETPYGEDEAHDPDPITSEDAINTMIEQRRMLKNGSYFAFTATPKNKTLETFGVKTAEGKFKPFDTYTMKQAIEEGFILDVLKNYTTYQSYYKLDKSTENNPEFETKQANKKLRAYVESHLYTTTILSEKTDANKLNDLQEALDNFQIYTKENVVEFTDLYFNNGTREQLEPIIDKCVTTFKNELNTDDQIDFYVKAKSFFRTYAFLSKILTFSDVYWERLYWFLKFILPKIKPEGTDDLAKGILEAIDLDSYRLSITTKENIKLKGDEEIYPTPPTMKGKKGDNEFDTLQVIINEFNARFGIDNWLDDDKIKQFLFEQLPKDFIQDLNTVNAVKNSDKQNAKITSDKKVENLMQDVIFTYTDLYKKFMDDPDFKRQYLDYVFDKIWQQLTTKN